MAVPLDKFVQQLEDSGILAGGTLKGFIPRSASPKDAEELALELIRKKKLTKFQAEEVSTRQQVAASHTLLIRVASFGTFRFPMTALKYSR